MANTTIRFIYCIKTVYFPPGGVILLASALLVKNPRFHFSLFQLDISIRERTERMTIRHLRIFIAVCKYKSTTLAAEKLYLAQPTVSLAIRELEDHYHVKLFDRISRKLYLTETGRQFLDYATHIVCLTDEMEEYAKSSELTAPLRIGASITIGTCLLPNLVTQFRQTHPHITINAQIENSETLEQKIMNNEIDFALIEGAVHNTDIVRIPFQEDELILICGNHHELLGKGPIPISDLKKYDFLLREKGSGTRELFDSILLTYDVSIQPVWTSISTQALINAVAAGLGLSVLPYQLAKLALKDHLVQMLEIEGVRFQRSFSCIYHKNKFLTKSAQEFIHLCKDNS